MIKFKLLYHQFFAVFHAQMLKAVTSRPEGTNLYLKHWLKFTYHRNLAKKLRVKALIHFDTDY